MAENHGRSNGRKSAANDEDSTMVGCFIRRQTNTRFGTTLPERVEVWEHLLITLH